MIVGEITIENSKLKAALAESRAEIRKLKDTARTEGAGLGNALFGKLGDAGSQILGKLGLAGGLVGIAGTIHSVMEEYGKLADMAARFNATPMSLQKLDMHAKLTGTTVESLVTGVQKLQRALADPGDPKVAKALDELKLTAVDLAGLEPDQQLEMIAAAFNEAQLAGRGFDSVFDLMGNSAGELIPALREFSANKERIASIKFLDDEDVAMIKKLGDTLTILWEKTKAQAVKGVIHGTGNNISSTGFLLGRILRGGGGGGGEKEGGGPGWAEGMGDAFEKFTSPEQLKLWTARFKASIDEQKNAMASQAADAEKIAAARKGLSDEEARAAEAGLSPLEKIESHKASILEKEKEIAALQGPGAEMEVRRLKLMQERAKLIGETAAMTKTYDEAQARGAEEMEKLHRDAVMGGGKLFGTKADQKKALRDQLAESLGLTAIGSSREVQDAMKKLQDQATNQTNSGDFDGAKATYAKLRDAQRQAGELSGMGRERGGAPGETATALNILTGGNQDRVVEETRNNGRLLDRILQALDTTSKGFGTSFT